MTRRISFLFLLLVLSLVACDKGRMWETPAVRPHEEPLLILSEDIVPFSGGEELYRHVDGETLEPPMPMDDKDVITAGKDAYAKFCAQCHGINLDGHGTVGQSFYPLPTGLRTEPVQYMADGLLFQIIGYSFPGLRHPGLATTITIPDRWRIVAYIKDQGIRQ